MEIGVIVGQKMNANAEEFRWGGACKSLLLGIQLAQFRVVISLTYLHLAFLFTFLAKENHLSSH